MAWNEDHAEHDGKGFNLAQLRRLVSNVEAQPNWRDPAQKCCDYYDGNQLAPEVKQVYEERGQPIIINNLIAPAIDAVLGMEARTRTDLVLTADDDDGEELRDALQEKFKDAWRLARADRANADAYASQIKAGIGWVEVTRNDDPFYGGGYNIKPVRRQEMWWDWNAQEADLSDARWLLRKRWVDVDEAIAHFPEHAEIIRQAMNNWEDFANLESYEEQDQDLLAAYHEFESWDRNTSEWLDQARGRICLQVIYYRTFRRGYVIDLKNGRTVEYNPNNIAQAVGVKMGTFKPRIATWSAVREAWFVGIHRITDRKSVAPSGYFPIVPFFGYRMDKSGQPYGVVSRMISAQDEINYRRMKLTWLLQAKRVIADQDATNMSREDLLEEVERADGYIELNPDRKNKKSISEAIQIQQDFNIASQQFTVMQDSMKQIQDVAGIYNAMLGQDSSATSGVAINSLVEQGATTLAEINDNYHYSRTRVADLLMAYLIEDLAKQSNIAVTVNKQDAHKRKVIHLNVTNDDGTVTNDVKRWKGHIAQAPIQQTATFRAQMAQQLTALVAQLPPQIQMATLDMVIELMDVPNKQEILNRIRQTLNIPKAPEDMTPEEQAAMQEEQRKQQEMAEIQMQQLQNEVALGAAKVEELQAKIAKLQRDAESQDVKDNKVEAETAKVLQEVAEVKAQADSTVNAILANIDQQLLNLQI
ncbi:portal protein [Vibrio sp. 2026]|uniref:portal protein n=1 Tax=unclassified Vibrio TaxID=2614977 RepID=UPI00296445EE|nr:MULTISPECIES: portal protein [unclassified Vibrio]MDW2118392.1 portal protein [Vibrio sp. 2026]MDW2206963.1 portal protein [Vibrio sp. 2025]HCM0785610.1 portal protein [Vibrio parahaemolyticus]